MTGPSAKGSEYGTPNSMISDPQTSSTFNAFAVVERSGSPAVIYGISATFTKKKKKRLRDQSRCENTSTYPKSNNVFKEKIFVTDLTNTTESYFCKILYHEHLVHGKTVSGILNHIAWNLEC